MAEHRPTMMNPPIEELLGKVEFSKFTLVTLAGRRARQINSYFSQLGEGLGTIVPPQVQSLSHKPVTIALEEIAESKIVAASPKHDDPAEPVDDAIALDPDASVGTGTPVA